MLRGIIFDLDGTLADTLPVCIGAYRSAFDQGLGRRYTDEAITALFGPNEEGIIRGEAPDRWRPILATYLAEYERLHAACSRPFAGVESMLGRLRTRGMLLAIVSGKGPGSAQISLSHLGLAPYFDIVETGSASGPIKPLSIHKVLHRWGLPADEAAYVGDTDSDMEAAVQAGVAPLGAAWAKTATVQQEGGGPARAVFAHVEDFLGWIESNTP